MSAARCDVATAYGTLQAVPRGAVQPGTAVVVAIRPERVRVAPAGEGIAADLVDVIYLGNSRKYVARLPDGRMCMALQHAEAAEASGLAPGQAVRLSWSPAHAYAFPD